MSQTPIFDQLAAEFAAEGKNYETMVKPIASHLPPRVRPYVKQQPYWIPASIVRGIQRSSIAVDEPDTVVIPTVKPLSERNTA